MIVSRSDQARFVRFLEKVGGYDEVLRLNREFRRVKAAGHKPMIVRDEVTKKYSVTAAFLQNELNEIGVVSGRPVCRKEQPGAQLSPMRDAREAELLHGATESAGSRQQIWQPPASNSAPAADIWFVGDVQMDSASVGFGLNVGPHRAPNLFLSRLLLTTRGISCSSLSAPLLAAALSGYCRRALFTKTSHRFDPTAY